MNIYYVTWLKAIPKIQTILLAVGIGIMIVLPPVLAYVSNISFSVKGTLYAISLYTVAFVMIVRPLADVLYGLRWLRSFVILRKGMGVLSASIIVSFMFSKLLADPGVFIHSFAKQSYWSLTNYALLAHLADISAIILLITSNQFSKRILGRWWKRLQRLSYVYFYGGIGYEALVFHSVVAQWVIGIVTFLTVLAFIINHTHNRK